MLADQLDYIVGVDPHRDSHALAVIEVVTGAVVFEATIAADGDGTPADERGPGAPAQGKDVKARAADAIPCPRRYSLGAWMTRAARSLSITGPTCVTG